MLRLLDEALDLPAPQRDGWLAALNPELQRLQPAHAQLVIHRDIKPSNVPVDANGPVKWLDFGVAKLLGDDCATADTELTHLGVRLAAASAAFAELLSSYQAQEAQRRKAPLKTGLKSPCTNACFRSCICASRRLDAYSLFGLEPRTFARYIAQPHPIQETA